MTAEPREFGIPGHCFDIDGDWWHDPGSCTHHADGRPCCGVEGPS